MDIEYPIKHWLLVIALGGLVLTFIVGLPPEGYIYILIVSLLYSLPSVLVYVIAYLRLVNRPFSDFKLKLLLNSLASFLLLITILLLWDPGSLVLNREMGVMAFPYLLFIFIISLFLRIRPSIKDS